MEGLEVDPRFWKNRRVFLTGHTGFKGGWLAVWLKGLGARVRGYALPAPTSPSLFEAARVADGIESVEGDVRDADALYREMAGFRPEIVVHMAAQALVRRSYEDPAGTYGTNVMGTVNVFDAVRRTGGVRAVVNVTSDKCYENFERTEGYREDERMGGYDPYSSSKGCAELVTAAYRRSFFNPADYGRHGVAVASARAGNVVGGGDWAADRLVPDIVRAIASGEKAKIRNPGATRPWQFVLEPLSGYLLLAQKLASDGPAFGEAWNFGCDEEDAKPVSWIADELVRLWGDGAGWEEDSGGHPHEARFLRLDCAKAKEKLGWAPRTGLAEALSWIVEWHRCHSGGGDVRAVTEEQIDRFQSLKGR